MGSVRKHYSGLVKRSITDDEAKQIGRYKSYTFKEGSSGDSLLKKIGAKISSIFKLGKRSSSVVDKSQEDIADILNTEQTEQNEIATT